MDGKMYGVAMFGRGPCHHQNNVQEDDVKLTMNIDNGIATLELDNIVGNGIFEGRDNAMLDLCFEIDSYLEDENKYLVYDVLNVKLMKLREGHRLLAGHGKIFGHKEGNFEFEAGFKIPIGNGGYVDDSYQASAVDHHSTATFVLMTSAIAVFGIMGGALFVDW